MSDQRKGVFTLALIGAGAMGRTHAEACRKKEGFRVVAVVDVDLEAGARLAEELGCAAFGSLEAMLAAERPEAAIVCTPPATHEPICTTLMEAGIAVLCEKPLTTSAAASRRLARVAKRCGVILTMAVKFRYVDDVLEARRLISEGVLGRIRRIENRFLATVDMSERWNSDPAVAGGGVFMDNGTHSVDLIRFLVGPIATVRVVEGPDPRRMAVEDSVRVEVECGDGVSGLIELSWADSRAFASYVDVVGERGALHVGWKGSELVLEGAEAPTPFGGGYDKFGALGNQLADFSAAVRTGSPQRIDLEDAIAAAEVIDAGYASLRSGEVVRIGEGSGASGSAAKGRVVT